jgi:HlyD family secretion protein
VLGAAACQRGEAPQPDTFQGIVELEQRVLAFEVPGRVIALPVERGERVAAGTLVASLDDALERQLLVARQSDLAVARAQATLVHAGSRVEDVGAMQAQIRATAAAEAQLARDLERTQKLAAAGAQTPVAVEEVGSRLRQITAERQALEQRLLALRRGARPSEREGASAQAEAAAAAVGVEAQRLQKYQLRTLAQGTVLDRHVELGEVVGAGNPVVTIADTRRPYVDVFVPERELGGIVLGAAATVRTDATTSDLRGRVELIAQRTEFTPRFLFSERERPNLVVRVRVRFSDPDELLHAGLPAFVHITRGAKAGAGGEPRDAR